MPLSLLSKVSCNHAHSGVDITEKANAISSNQKLFVEELKLAAADSPDGLYLQKFVVLE